ncbi:replication-relaxation family protein [Kutzneria sp. NPDC051319]|uniref:replication-relaxation family protein n=1 Tax=Kutzneria sp. NPDC051319 TaxID=3155047 RepID=UPI0034187778
MTCARRRDAYGRWRIGGVELEFFLDFDFGTENLRALASKLRGYGNLATTTAIATPVLLRFASPGREATARRALEDALAQLDRPHLLPIATSTTDSRGHGHA